MESQTFSLPLGQPASPVTAGTHPARRLVTHRRTTGREGALLLPLELRVSSHSGPRDAA